MSSQQFETCLRQVCKTRSRKIHSRARYVDNKPFRAAFMLARDSGGAMQDRRLLRKGLLADTPRSL